MVKVSITTENGKASVNLDVPYSKNTALYITSNLCNVLSYPDKVSPCVCNATKEDEERIEEILEKEKEHPTILSTKVERPAFRDRLPNNVVDVHDLTIEQAVKENALVRCPSCGQSHAIIVHSSGRMYMMRKDYTKKEFVSIAEWPQSDTDIMLSSCCTEETNKEAYFNDLQNISENTNIGDFFVNNDTEIFCPVCNQSEKFLNWKDAYENPLHYFETEQLCDACGGEVVEKVIKGHAFKHCEKCGLEQEVPNE